MASCCGADGEGILLRDGCSASVGASIRFTSSTSLLSERGGWMPPPRVCRERERDASWRSALLPSLLCACSASYNTSTARTTTYASGWRYARTRRCVMTRRWCHSLKRERRSKPWRCRSEETDRVGHWAVKRGHVIQGTVFHACNLCNHLALLPITRLIIIQQAQHKTTLST